MSATWAEILGPFLAAVASGIMWYIHNHGSNHNGKA